ncbi:unnamed protein product [Pedinophyceae sp. YPF-701]|nr:unnamed protein product [Pedinophyceae sp. YPF-701]
MERFEKIRTVGRGAQGSVILVRRKQDGSLFVIKRLFVDERPESDRTDVMNEIIVLSQLHHPNIVAYYGSFIEDGVLNVVMEYADNGSLSDHITKASKMFAEDTVVSFFAQLLLAINHLHQRKILHRDIKTKNIFVTRRMQVKLGDFGLSKVLDTTAGFAQSAVGTPYYLSPELCQGRPYNYKSDIWALGCVMYEMATFRHAFDATSLPALVMAIVRGEYSPIEPQYSTALQDAINRCLRKDPEDRASVEDLLQLPLLQPHLQRCAASNKAYISEMAKVERPLFTSGQVETPLTNIREGWQAQQQRATKEDEEKAILKVLEDVEGDEGQLAQVISELRAATAPVDRIQGRMPVYCCFTGAALCDALLTRLQLGSRSLALIVGQRWLESGLFYHVARGEKFLDSDDALYRFRQDEVGAIINLKSLYAGGPTSPAEAEAAVRQRLVAIIAGYTSSNGELLDYEGLALSEEFKQWTDTAASLQRVDPAALPSTPAKIAMFINLYNMLVVHGFLVIGPPSGPAQRAHFEAHTSYTIGGSIYSLADIYHGVLRGNRRPHAQLRCPFTPSDPRLQGAVLVWDPRIHFVLNHGTRSGARLAAYEPSRLEEQLDEQTRICLTNIVTVEESVDGRVEVTLPTVMQWYPGDFGETEAQRLLWVARFLPAARASAIRSAVSEGSKNAVVKFLPPNWHINKLVRPAPPPIRGMPRGGRGAPQPLPGGPGGFAAYNSSSSGAPSPAGPPPRGPRRTRDANDIADRMAAVSVGESVESGAASPAVVGRPRTPSEANVGGTEPSRILTRLRQSSGIPSVTSQRTSTGDPLDDIIARGFVE